MIGKLFRAAFFLLICLCVGTVFAQVIGVGYAVTTGALQRDNLVQIMAIIHGLDLEGMRRDAEEKHFHAQPEQTSLDDIEMARALRVRHIELREQALADEARRLDLLRRQLQKDQTYFQTTKTAFEQYLAEFREGALAQGLTDTQVLWENLKPKQAKDQIKLMYDEGDVDEVIIILRAMSPAKLAKIAAEFKTEDEPELLAEITRLIRDGAPTVDVADQTQTQLQQPAGAGL